jgi:hypothetical protein
VAAEEEVLMRANFEKFRPLAGVAVRVFAVGGQNRFSSPGGLQVYCRFFTYLDLLFIQFGVCPISPNSYLIRPTSRHFVEFGIAAKFRGGGKKTGHRFANSAGITELGIQLNSELKGNSIEKT